MLEFSRETLDGVDESLHSFYEKGEKGYTLKVNGLEDTSGLKSALEKEREANKGYKSKLTEAEKREEAAQLKILEEQGNYKALSERDKQAKLEAQKALDDLVAEVANAKRDSLVRNLALSMTSDKDEIDIISRFASDYIEINGKDVTFNKTDEELKASLSRFVKNKATGVGDRGNNGTSGSKADISSLNGTEKMKLGRKK